MEEPQERKPDANTPTEGPVFPPDFKQLGGGGSIPISRPPLPLWPLGHVFEAGGTYRVKSIVSAPSKDVAERRIGEGGSGYVYLVEDVEAPTYRFAVKRALEPQHPTVRKCFYDELTDWQRLPAHPNIAPCCFVRHVDGEALVFSEYVEGGSLSTWIGKPPFDKLGGILDCAIQMAIGLEVAHRFGLVHQDVKPANVLIGKNHFVKLTDFGSARARSDWNEEGPINRQYTYRNCTPSYRSPEQARIAQERKETRAALKRWVTLHTDMWSWAVTVLQMFSGRAISYGEAAAAELEDYLRGARAPGRPAIPEQVAAVLTRCLKTSVGERYASMFEVASKLIEAYPKLLGRNYPGGMPSFPEVRTEDNPREIGGGWDDPGPWLARAQALASGFPVNPLSPEAGVERRPLTRQAMALADLGVFDEAKGIYERLITKEGGDLTSADAAGEKYSRRIELTKLTIQHALALEFIGDLPEAVRASKRGVELLDPLRQEGQAEDTFDEICYYAGWAHLRGANSQQRLGLSSQALHHYTAAIVIFKGRADQRKRKTISAIWKGLVDRKYRKRIDIALALAYMNRASVHHSQGHLGEALAGYEAAINIWEIHARSGGSRGIAGDLAAAYMNRANTLHRLGRFSEAFDALEAAIGREERLVKKGDRADALASAYLNQAISLRSVGRLDEALSANDKALGALKRLVNADRRSDLKNVLAKANVGRAVTLRSLGRHSEALASDDEAVNLLRALVYQGGRPDLAGDLSMAYDSRSCTLHSLDRLTDALADARAAIDIAESHVRRSGRQELIVELAKTYTNRAITLEHMRRFPEALADHDAAIRLFGTAVDECVRLKRTNDRATAFMYRAITLQAMGCLEDALLGHNEAIQILQLAMHASGPPAYWIDLGMVHEHRASTLHALGRLNESLADFDVSIKIQIGLMKQGNWPNLANDLARAHRNRGTVLEHLERPSEAIEAYDAAVALRVNFSRKTVRPQFVGELAGTYLARANAYCTVGRFDDAVAGFDAAIKIMEELVNEHDRPESAKDLIKSYINRASVLQASGRGVEAVVGYDKAIETLGNWHNSRRLDLFDFLTVAQEKRAKCVRTLRNS